jgi:prepilin-type N-terminal cleavage/methylation domain-containing protein
MRKQQLIGGDKPQSGFLFEAPQRASLRGYTLVEIMVVVALIGVVSALAGPNISKAVRRANEPAQMLRVHGFLVQARNYARRTNQCVKVTRNSTGTSLTARPVSLCAATDTCACRASVAAAETFVLDLTKQLPPITVTSFANNTGVASSLTAEATGDALLFFPNGATPYPATATVNVALPERGPKTITILPASGIMRVQP